MADAHKNFAVSAIATAPAPADSGTSLGITAGHGTRFPAAPFNAVVCPANTQPAPNNAEIVRVTALSGDTFTIVRTQEGSSARSIQAGDQVFAGVTAKTLADAETILTVTTPLLNGNNWGNGGFVGGSTGYQYGMKLDLTKYSQVRLTLMRITGAATVGSKLALRYAPTFTSSSGSYSDIGTTEVSVSLDSTVTSLDSGWLDLASGARGDVVVMPIAMGGNNADDPGLGVATFQFR